MTKQTHRISEDVEGLKQLRDEFRVQLHLGKAEARERFEKLESTWEHLEARLKIIREESSEDLSQVREAAGLLVGEIRDGYRHLRSLL
jgi:BMFP domain-containing protein YqiC